MKKTFLLLTLILMCTMLLSGCTKTEVENDLQQENKDKQVVTDDEYNSLMEDEEFAGDYIRETMEADEEQNLDESVNLINKLEDSKDDKQNGKSSKGSCNDIAENSTCIDFYGSFWNEQAMRSMCTEGTFSFDACPRDMAGGCNAGVGMPTDMVAWLYTYGGESEDITAASLKNAKNACDATMASEWITAN